MDLRFDGASLPVAEAVKQTDSADFKAFVFCDF